MKRFAFRPFSLRAGRYEQGAGKLELFRDYREQNVLGLREQSDTGLVGAKYFLVSVFCGKERKGGIC